MINEKLLAGLLGILPSGIDIKNDTNIDGPSLKTYVKLPRRSLVKRSGTRSQQVKRTRWKMAKRSRKVNYQRHGTRG